MNDALGRASSAAPSPELEEFLSDLGAQRDRLAVLAGAGPSAALIDELTLLGERLLIADEELRVQQEELLDVRRRLTARTAERELLTSQAPAVRTDLRGLVLLSNVSAARLVQRAPVQSRNLPIASWFAVADRVRVRSLVTDVVRSGRPQSAESLRLSRPASGTEVDVDVHVHVETDEPQHTLRWLLLARGRPDQGGGQEPGVVPDLLAEDLTALALDLVRQRPASSVLRAASVALVGLVVGADSAVVSVGKHGEAQQREASDGDAESCETLAFASGEGPGPAAAGALGRVVDVRDLAADTRWPGLAKHAEERGLRSVVSIAMALPSTDRQAVLTWYASTPGAFSSAEVARVALLAATHVSVALDRALMQDNLMAALATRQLIGEAVGALAVRDGISTQAAFERLVAVSQRSNRKLRDVAEQLSARMPRD